MWLSWHFSSVINVHKLFDIPQKLICLLRKNCGLDRHTELLEITGSHLRAVRKAVEYLSISLGGWLHVVDTFASSKMCTDKLNMCENVCAACGKTPLLPLKRFPPPLKDDTMFSGPLSDEHLLQQPVVNKLLGLDAQKTVTMCCAAASALQQNQKRHCRKLQIRSHYTATNMTGTVLRIIWAPRLIHSVSIPMSMNNASRVHCAAEQETVPLNWG